MESIPERLRPKVTVTRNQTIIQYYNFTANEDSATIDERKWLCAEVNGDNPPWQYQTQVQL